MTLSTTSVLQQLKLHIDNSKRKSLGEPEAAVLIPIFDKDGVAQVLLTQRSQSMKRHSGQISFPGGKIDEGETVVDAAIRETYEEVGIPVEDIEIIGKLDDFNTTHYIVTPVLAKINPEKVFINSPQEVVEILFVPLSDLKGDNIHRIENWDYMNVNYLVHFYDLKQNGKKYNLWGATAGVLHRMLNLVK